MLQLAGTCSNATSGCQHGALFCTAGSDVTVVAKEAAMRPLRRLMAVLEPSVYNSTEGSKISNTNGSSSSKASSSRGAAAGNDEAGLQLGPVTAQDVAAALAATKPSAQAYEAQYAEFSMKYGQVV
jgi:katanin p60 ATPase-containing subunit A1